MRNFRRTLTAMLPLAAGAAVVLTLMPDGSEERQGYAIPEEITFGDWESPYRNCLDGVNPHACVRRLVTTATAQGEFGPALAMLQSGIEAAPELIGACHGLAHEVGEGVVKAGHSLWDAYELSWPHCAEGYYHGALWEHSRGMDSETLQAEKERLCEPFGPPENPSAQECAHLIGHLFLYAQDLDIGGSLQECESFDDYMLQLHCADGVFMEAVDQARGDTDFEGLDIPKDPEAWRALFGDEEKFPEAMLQECREAPESMRVPCLIGLPNALAVLWEFDFARVGAFCGSLPEGRESDLCFRGVSVAGFNHFSWDPELIAGACYSYEHEGNELCIANASEALAEYYGVFDLSAVICQIAREEHRQMCLDGVRLGLERNAAYKSQR